MRYLISIVVIAAMAVPVVAAAAFIDPNLDIEMEAAGDDYVPVLIFMKDKVAVNELVASLEKEKASFARRHYEVVTQLKEKSAATQKGILSALAANDAKSIRSFWIGNMIAARLRPVAVEAIAARADVKSVMLDPPIELIEPVSKHPDTRGVAADVEIGITATRAPEMWALGYDGSTAIACDQDTGADGTHPAFADRWLGLEVPPEQAWFDPLDNETFPTEATGRDHGTHTLGTMVGDDGAGNQIGMAPAAKWIGAKTIDAGGDIFSDAVAAFQWAADPDGNPATTDDVPDVINNSWGLSPWYYGGCLSDFNDSIDAAEAAGVVVIFAAGNEGPDSESLRSPANRISTLINVLAVGALQEDAETIADFSSRGPSDCDSSTIKPEVCAVGVEVRSAMPGGDYQTMSGTSMAAPHVSGAVLLLRDAFPDASPEDIKWALYITAVDLGDPGEDNTYGRGRIDVMEAYYYLLNNHDCDRDIDNYDSQGDCGGNDCNDYDPDIHPDHVEICGDNKDNDCNGLVDADDPGVDQSNPEICGDGRDNNCNGDVDYADAACAAGGPDAFGYTWDYSEPFVWNDVSDGLSGPHDDEGVSDPIDLGFDFAFYGEYLDLARVTTNGHITFADETHWQVYCDESQFYLNSIAGLWLDLANYYSGEIYYKTVGEAPNRSFVAQWDEVPTYYDDSNTGTFQVVLEEGTNDVIVYIDDGYVDKLSNIFIRGTQDGHYLSSHCGEFMPENGMAVRFKYPDEAHCAGCWIDGMCYADGAAKFHDPCLICDLDQSSDSWSNNVDGLSCDDGVWCNGDDQCASGVCSTHDGDPCGDDGTWCNGEEYCDEDADSCKRQNAPDCSDDGVWCNGEEYCDENNDECSHKNAPECPDDGLFCNGAEFCDEENRDCGVKDIPDCSDDGLWCNGEEFCDEENDECGRWGALECPDDGVWCNGEEACDEQSKNCANSGNPCGEDQQCDEEYQECVNPGDDDSANDDDIAGDDDDDDDSSDGSSCSFI